MKKKKKKKKRSNIIFEYFNHCVSDVRLYSTEQGTVFFEQLRDVDLLILIYSYYDTFFSLSPISPVNDLKGLVADMGLTKIKQRIINR